MKKYIEPIVILAGTGTAFLLTNSLFCAACFLFFGTYYDKFFGK